MASEAKPMDDLLPELGHEIEVNQTSTAVTTGTGSSRWPLAVNGCKVPGYKGIYESRERPYLWYARAVHAGTRYYLGYYDDVDVAQKAVYCCEEHGKEKCHEMYPCATREDPLFARRPRPKPKQDHGVYASNKNPHRFVAQANFQGKRYYLGIHDTKADALQAVADCELYGPSSVKNLNFSSTKRKASGGGQASSDNIYKNSYTDSAKRRAKQAKFIPDTDVTVRTRKPKKNSEEDTGTKDGTESKPQTESESKGSEKVDLQFF